MAEPMLSAAQEAVRAGLYYLAPNAADAALEQGLNRLDLESIVLTGDVVERQQDRLTGGWKLLISGESVSGRRATVVTRQGISGYVVLVTLFRRMEAQ